ncbi:hypothetical protein HYC85_027401 [Camellia sinensis]|uniref:Uncharacterized protein n=1 Tax=Camellia sinensis TaxID=4442 RepID=A0A7J7G6B3_CAMSI|nr:hypothetical protein HYC85_027401 [Camellia sinensis]
MDQDLSYKTQKIKRREKGMKNEDLVNAGRHWSVVDHSNVDERAAEPLKTMTKHHGRDILKNFHRLS